MSAAHELMAGHIVPPDLLRLSDLCIDFADGMAYGRRVVDRINLTVKSGSFAALIGESGSGKSLTCLSCLGLVDRSARLSGEILFDGTAFAADDRRAAAALRGRDIAMIFQDPKASLNPVRSIGVQLIETIRLHRPETGGHRARELAVDLLDRVGLDRSVNRMSQYPHELSGGMNQRVMIALALACRPKMLIADEPTTALDARIQRQVMDLIDEIRLEEGLTVLLVSHDLAQVWDYADHISVMREGRIVEAGTPEELAGRERLHPYAEQLFRSAGFGA